MRLFLVVLLVVGIRSDSSFIPVPPATCVFSFLDDTFNSVPQHTQNPFCGIIDNNCCGSPYMSSLNTSADLMSPIFNDFFTGVTPECSATLNTLKCAPCYGDNYAYSSQLSQNSWKILLCSDYCSSLFTSCEGSTVSSGSLVSERYFNSEVFCSAIFGGSNIIVNVLPSSSLGCFNPLVRACTADDIDFHYSECIGNRRSLIYSWKDNTTCAGGVKLPTSLANLPCPVDCEAGFYLPLGTTTCVPCSAGTYSLSGGHKIHTWDSWPTRYLDTTTYCTDTMGRPVTNCNGWSLNGSFVDSNIAGLHNRKSVLNFQFNIVSNGSLSFETQVDCEYSYDRLILSIDGAQTWIKNTINPTRYTFPLSDGYHFVSFIYKKDSSVNFGYDKAMLFELQVLGLADASDFCDQCPRGTTSSPQATQCSDCPLNTYNNQLGSSVCIPCSDDEYAFPGDTQCTPRKACTVNDYQSLYTPCSLTHTRTEYFDWISPRICAITNVTLPPNVPDLPCAPCNPGEFRVADECYVCPTGKFSTIGTLSECTSCPMGTYAPKQLTLQRWDELPAGASSSCEGQCGTAGWRVRGDYVDSGIDHGSHSTSTLVIPVIIEASPTGWLSWKYSLNCEMLCYVDIRDGRSLITSTWHDSFTPVQNITGGPVKLPPGAHNITFIFGKFFGRRNEDRVMLYELVVEGVDQGGASECLNCSAGTWSGDESESCTACIPGTYSVEGSSGCSDCPVNTYQDLPQQTYCKPCGAATHTAPGSPECSTNACTYSPPGTSDSYDISLLTRQNPYGPIPDNRGVPLYHYYILPCSFTIFSNNQFFNEDHQLIDGFAYEFEIATNISVSLGRVMGYYPLPASSKDKGFILSLTEGTPGCDPERPRALNITMICDPSAGIGLPQKDSTSMDDTCTYQMTWRSIYACPLCTRDDFQVVIGACTGGKQNITYVWKHSPPRCHSGVSPPEMRIANCSTTSTCGAGYYLLPTGTCEMCPDGQYSYGEEITDLNDFVASCSGGGCSNWGIRDGYFFSGRNTSKLELTRNFKSNMNGEVQFTYKYIGQNSRFTFYIDSRLELDISQYNLGSQVFSIPVSRGTHTLKWVFAQEDKLYPLQRDSEVLLSDVKLQGTVSAFASCKSCNSGERTEDDKAGCRKCTLNTEPASPATYCVPCDNDQYRLVGMSSCQLQPACDQSDFFPMYSKPEKNRCEAGDQRQPSTVNYLTRIPCRGDPPTPDNHCFNCPRGTFWNTEALFGAQCTGCPEGSYKKGSGCAATSPGHMAVTSAFFFMEDDVVEMKGDFETTCVGSCSYNTEGWRFLGSTINSGVHFGDVDSSFSLFLNTEESVFIPTVTFSVTLNPVFERLTMNSHSGLEFYIDGKLQNVPFSLVSGRTSQFTFEIPNTALLRHKLTWVYSQYKTDDPFQITLKNVIVNFTSSGVPAAQIACPAGTHYVGAQKKCLICPAGSYSKAESSACTPCPSGTVSHAGDEQCTPCDPGTESSNNVCRGTCVFKDDNSQESHPIEYDLTVLKGSIFTVSDDSGSYYEINLCNHFYSDDCNEDSCREDSYIFAEHLVSHMKWSVPHTLGTNLKFLPTPRPQSSFGPMIFPTHSFTLQYSGGKKIPPECSTVMTTIEFICNDTIGFGAPVLVKSDLCYPTFRWSSIYACHKCMDTELIQVPGACVSGKRTVTYTWANPCFGDVPTPTIQPCEDVNLAKNTAIMVMSSIAIVVVVGVGLTLVFIQQRNTLKAQYKLLKVESNIGDSAEEALEQVDQKVELSEDEDEDLPVDKDNK